MLDEIKQEVDKTLEGQLRRTLLSRIRMIINYVAVMEGKCDGRRHTVMLIWYSSLVQLVGTSRAQSWLHKLNALFVSESCGAHPLSPVEIQDIVRSVEKAGPYKFKNATICSSLNLSKEQYAEMAYSPKERNKRAQKKQQTQYKKNKRNQIVLDAINHGYTYEEVAKIANCSITTVKRVKNKMHNSGDSVQT